MDSVTYSELRQSLASIMDRVDENRAPILITRRGGKPAVLMSLDDFASYEETAYLKRSPRNADRLTQAIDELREGRGSEHELND